MRDLLCYAHGHEGSWEAICVDLDLSVQGTSMEDVMRRLDKAVHSYVADARKEAPEIARGLLRRKAPFHVRISFWLRFQWYTLTRKRRHAGTAVEYGLPCPA